MQVLSGGLALSAWRMQRGRWLPRGTLRAALLAFSVLATGHATHARAQEPVSAMGAASERSVKAAFLYKFLGYVEWPAEAFASPESPIVIGVLGADDIAAELTQIAAGRTANNRPIAVRRLRETDSLSGLHMLFIGRSEAPRMPAVTVRAQRRSVLTVTETPQALDQGAIINFRIVDGRVRFDISIEAAERSGLKLSSRLLAVAQNVRTGS